jgi:alkanesulfonate monooxygenase SsuD/methylene tetrahydromethanopterin reductase-like flavin-dependent oxidoreductase (luciferase family)
MVNEHHNAPYCMQPRITVWSSILAAVTKRVKIVQLGNPLPTYDSPLMFAEEIAMIDMISQGSLGVGHRARCGPRDDLSQREPGLQPRALQRSA